MEPTVAPSVRLMVVDDHEIVRQGLIALFRRHGQYRIVAQAGSVRDALTQVHLHEPDVVVMDLRLPDGSGLDACRAICDWRPETRVVILTSYPDAGGVDAAVAAGAAGYLLKGSRARDLMASIDAVVAGESLRDAAVLARVRDSISRRLDSEESPEIAQLTGHERRILGLLADGMSNRGIARAMRLSDKTVKNYVSNVLGKLQLQRRTQAAAFLADRGSFRSLTGSRAG